MKQNKLLATATLSALTLLAAAPVIADGAGGYDVTITNLTRNQTFTPILVASHRGDLNLVQPGQPASPALTALAEGGDTSLLEGALTGAHRGASIANSGGLLGPGESVTVTVERSRGANRITLASMLIPTNDGFIALDSVAASWGNHETRYTVPAYDAGSETNDESCANIPGPVCGGTGPSPHDVGEGYVHVHGGIHGIGDLESSGFDWRNPVAEVTIRRHH